MLFSFATLTQWLLTYKYAFLFPLAVIEGPIVTVLAGILSATGHLNLWIAYVLVVVADVAGDSIYYSLARWNYAFVEKYGGYIGLTTERIEKNKIHFDQHVGKTLIFGKLAYSIEVPFLLAAGLANVPYRIFLLYVFIPSVPKSLLFILIGYYFGSAIGQIMTYYNIAALLMLLVAFALVAVYFILNKVSRAYAD